MKPMFIIKEYDQLKALSDPFRVKLMIRLVEKPYTGQQLSEILDLSRARIHYHLKELEKLGLIEIVKTEEKNGIVQKFYQSVASGFYPDSSMLPHKEEITETKRHLMYGMLDRTMARVLSAPPEAFEQAGPEDPSEWNILATSLELKVTEEQFKSFIDGYLKLIKEYQNIAKDNKSNPDVNYYYLTAFGFQVDESEYEKRVMKEEKDR